ncbi:hypothetical protein [Herbaspirillum robiniae]|nr:hypothetical protein [Herbaspirillum robiniae]
MRIYSFYFFAIVALLAMGSAEAAGFGGFVDSGGAWLSGALTGNAR